MVRGVVAARAKAHAGVKAIVWMPTLDGAVGRKRAGERVRRMRVRLVSHSKESYSLLSKKRLVSGANPSRRCEFCRWICV